MKRLRLEYFVIGAGAYSPPATAETPWENAFTCRADLFGCQEDQRLNQLLGVKGHVRAWYSQTLPALNPLAKLPTGVVIEKVNRAAELLGILED